MPSSNVAAMQATADPGEVGTESLATSTEGEIQRLRNMLKEITGKTQWYETPASSLAELTSAVGGALPDNRISSGRTRTGTSQPLFLVPIGTGTTVDIKGATTNFVYFIDGAQYTISTDVTSANLTVAPSTNNTALVNDASVADQPWTKYLGEYDSALTMDTVGTEISSRVGELAGFKINDGSSDEYFTARIKSATELTEIRRGYCFDENDAPVPRLAIANNDTITYLKLHWMFATTTGTLVSTAIEPIVSKDEPTSPSVGPILVRYD